MESKISLKEHGLSTLKAIFKYRKHPSVIAITSKCTKECFSFNMITIEDTPKEISKLDNSKFIKAIDVTVKVTIR